MYQCSLKNFVYEFIKEKPVRMRDRLSAIIQLANSLKDFILL